MISLKKIIEDFFSELDDKEKQIMSVCSKCKKAMATTFAWEKGKLGPESRPVCSKCAQMSKEPGGVVQDG